MKSKRLWKCLKQTYKPNREPCNTSDHCMCWYWQKNQIHVGWILGKNSDPEIDEETIAINTYARIA